MRRQLSDRSVLALAIVSAIVAANAYYIHPIIGLVAESFGVSSGIAGLAPTLNQFALALGVIVLLPLADAVGNRRMIAVCLVAQLLSLIAMATLNEFYLFLAASSTLGFFTITPYLLPAYASKRVDAKRLGFVTAILTTGVIAGAQISRFGSGLIAEYFGWRWVYGIAATLMVFAIASLPVFMDTERDETGHKSPNTRRLTSLVDLSVMQPRLLISGVIQGINFGVFISMWIGIALHLTSDQMAYGSGLVGLLAAFSAIAVIFTPTAGWCVDRLGSDLARVLAASGQLAGIILLSAAGSNWWYLLIPIASNAVLGPVIDIAGRITGLSLAEDARTRAMSLYITLMFIGGGLGSLGGAFAYDNSGWWGVILFTNSLAATVVLLSVQQLASKPSNEPVR